MRLSPHQQQQIASIVRRDLGHDAGVSLFGSRTDDHKHGGDVDLFIEAPTHLSLLRRADLKLALESALQLPVDLVFHQTGKPATPFQSLANAQAQPLEHVTR